MTRVPNRGPFAQAAKKYLEAGWCPLPLPARKKNSPPSNWTGGHEYRLPDVAQLAEWAKEYPGGNIALRLPHDLIGVDVDNYDDKHGAATLANLEAELGKLPPAWKATSRDDNVSGIRLFRVPAGRKWPGKFGPGIDVIQPGHRYIVASPSIHPETGFKYTWTSPAGYTVPFAELEETRSVDLPSSWVGHWDEGERISSGPAPRTSSRAVQRWLKSRPDGDMCEAMRANVDRALRVFGDGESGHDTASGAIWGIVRDAHEGHSGVLLALDAVHAFFVAEVYRRRRPEELESEWQRGVAGAVAKVRRAEGGDSGCLCGPQGDEPWGSLVQVAEDAPDPLEAATAKRKLQLEANRRALQEIAAEGWAPPEDEGTLADQLAEPRPPIEFFVDRLAGVGNILLVSQWKAGKTTLLSNLVKAAVDRVAFLDTYKVALPEGRTVAYSNYEVGRNQMVGWLDDMDIENSELLHVRHLRGVAYPLMSKVVEDECVEYLRSRNVHFWVIDPYGAAIDHEENSNSDTREWTKVIDRIKERAGVDVVGIAVHTGGSEEKAEQARGAARLMDWADFIWTYRHAGKGIEVPPDSRRWLSAFGRDADERDIPLDFDASARWMRTVTDGVSRAEGRLETLAQRAVAIVARAGRPLKAGEVDADMGVDARMSPKARTYAVKRGWLKLSEVGNAKLFDLGEESPDYTRVDKSWGSEIPREG